MFIFELIGRMIGNMIKLAILFIVVLFLFNYYDVKDDGKSSFTLAIEPVYTDKKPNSSGLIIPQNDPRFYQEIR